jgi:cytochrome P450
MVHRAAEVSALLRDERLWNKGSVDHRLRRLTPEHRAVRQELGRFLALWPAFSDGPYHRRVRAELIEGLAGPATVDARQRLASDIAMLDGLVGGRFDLVKDFAWPYALRIVSAAVGVSLEEAGHLANLGATVLNTMAAAPSTIEGVRAALAAADQLQGWLAAAMTEHASSGLVKALSGVWHDPEFGPRVTQVITGAMEPVVTALCVLAERVGPDELRELPVPALREEVLRLATPFRLAVRYARCPLEIGGHPLSEGDRVALHLGTANVDPDVVPEPLAMRSRQPQTHLAFGLGPHYCPGAGVARTALDVVLCYLKERDLTFHCEVVRRAPEVSTLRYRELMCTLR